MLCSLAGWWACGMASRPRRSLCRRCLVRHEARGGAGRRGAATLGLEKRRAVRGNQPRRDVRWAGAKPQLGQKHRGSTRSGETYDVGGVPDGRVEVGLSIAVELGLAGGRGGGRASEQWRRQLTRSLTCMREPKRPTIKRISSWLGACGQTIKPCLPAHTSSRCL